MGELGVGEWVSASRLVDGFAYVGALRFAKYDIIFSNAVQSERGLNRKKANGYTCNV